MTAPHISPTPEDDESYPIRPREIGLFVLFGTIPILLLYLFASQGVQDERGEFFGYERKLLIAGCMEQLDDRQLCRTMIDEPLMECYKEHALPSGEVAQRDALQACVTGRDDHKFRPPQTASESVQ